MSLKDQRYTGKEEEKKESPIRNTLNKAALVGGGALAYKNRKAIAKAGYKLGGEAIARSSRAFSRNSDMTRMLSKARVIGKGLTDALGDNPSLMRTIRASYDANIQNKMSESYRRSIRNSLKEQSQPNGMERKTKLSFVEQYTKLFRTGGTKEYDRFTYDALRAEQSELILKHLKNDKLIKNRDADGILNAITNYNHQQGKILSNPKEYIDDFTKKLEQGHYATSVKFSGEQERELFKNNVQEAITKHKSLKTIKENYSEQVEKRARAYKAMAAYSLITGQNQSSNAASYVLRKNGYRAQMVSDYEKASLETKRNVGLTRIELDKNNNEVEVDLVKEIKGMLSEVTNMQEFRKLQAMYDNPATKKDVRDLSGLTYSVSSKHKDLNGDLIQDKELFADVIRGLDFKLDNNLLIHETTGEVIDNRHIKETAVNAIDTFQKTVKMPFLNFNPVDLTPWQAMRSGKVKEGFHVLRAGEVHGYVQGLKEESFDNAAQSRHKDAIRGGLKSNNNVYVGGNVFHYSEEEGISLLAKDTYLVPSQFGPFSRAYQNQLNYTDKTEPDTRGMIRKFFDVGNQENDSRFTIYKKAWEKLDDPNYGPNMMSSLLYDLFDNVEKGALTAEKEGELITNAYNHLRKGIQLNARSMSQEAAEVMAPKVNQIFKNVMVEDEAFDFARLSDDRYLRKAAVALTNAFEDSPESVMRTKHARMVYEPGDLSKRVLKEADYEDPTVSKIKSMVKQYQADPEEFIHGMKVDVPRQLPSFFDFIVPILTEDQALISNTDELRKTIHQYALRRIDKEMGDLTSDLVKNGVRQRSSVQALSEFKNVRISESDIKNAKDLELLTDLMLYDNMKSVDARPMEAKAFFQDMVNVRAKSVELVDDTMTILRDGSFQYTDLGQDLQEGIRRAQPIFGRAPEASEPNFSGSDFMIMNKSRVFQRIGTATDVARNQLAYLNLTKQAYGTTSPQAAYDTLMRGEEILRQGVLPAGKGMISEMFAGRHRKSDNLEDVTTLTNVVYGLAERLDNQIQNFGLGLSRQNMGSFQSIMANQYMRRIALPYMAYQQAVYFDGLTGDKISDAAADAYVNTHTTLQDIKEFTQINRVMRPWQRVFEKSAGLDQVGEWVGVKQFNFLTMGLFSDFRSGEETRDYYEHGEDPIRKNRYWSIGSPSPWAGSGIDYYAPNWYRRVKSDYKFTDTMYGSEDEYWANHWMPTLTHPLAPIKHFLTDPYYYEKKHEKDRPYAITGGFSEIQNIPLIGSALDGTVGRILKPRQYHEGLEKAHEEYLSAINDYISSQYTAVNDGAYVTVNPSGGIKLNDLYGEGASTGFGGSSGDGNYTYGANAGLVRYDSHEKGVPAGGGFGGIGAGGSGGFGFGSGTGTGTGGSGGYADAPSATDRVRISLANANYQLVSDGMGKESIALSKLDNLHDPNLVFDLQDAEQLSSLKGQFMDAFYSAGELAGIYGFATKAGIGFDESWRGMTLAPSSLMTSYSRSFWDLNLGGYGGSLSEIGRRYVPRDMNKLYYSPIRNTMPDWLPGIESGVQRDFLHGDPYTKIQQGEMRLPGRSYEALYDLHPDGSGEGEWANYGAFDRFRILADVAPGTAQYEVAKSQVTQLRAAGGMTEDMEKEFAQIEDQVREKKSDYRWYDKQFTNAKIKEKTVTITEVLDANTFMTKEFATPIKLAGVKIEDDEGDAAEWLSQFIKYGEKIKIGIADDPGSRYNDDVNNSIKAVVYANKNDEYRFGAESIRGQSLNAILANKKWDSKVTVKDDGNPVSVRALYGDDMVTVGKYMEFLTHNILPNIPIVGVAADKFLQVRSPIESYKREEIYNKSWKPWQEPIQSWVVPMLNTVASNNPIVAGGQGAGIGWLAGKVGPANMKNKYKGTGAIIGGIIGTTLATGRVLYEQGSKLSIGNKEVWLPRRVEEEREIDEYFDRIKYIKYKGLYERTKRIAEQEEGIDVDRFFEAAEEKGRKNKGLKKFLSERSRWLKLNKATGYADDSAIDEELDNLSAKKGAIEGDRQTFIAGKYASLAIQYRKEYESTMYGMDPASVDPNSLLKALSPKDKEFVPKFLEASSSKERQEILKYVPDDIKRVLQAKWGLHVDKKENIESYFKDHYLPDANWSGWAAAVNLDEIKIKVMKQKGINPTEAGYWDKDQGRAENSGAKAIPIHSLAGRIDMGRLKEVLQGTGLTDVDVQMTTSYGEGAGGINISTHIVKDLSNEILSELNAGVGLF